MYSFSLSFISAEKARKHSFNLSSTEKNFVSQWPNIAATFKLRQVLLFLRLFLALFELPTFFRGSFKEWKLFTWNVLRFSSNSIYSCCFIHSGWGIIIWPIQDDRKNLTEPWQRWTLTIKFDLNFFLVEEQSDGASEAGQVSQPVRACKQGLGDLSKPTTPAYFFGVKLMFVGFVNFGPIQKIRFVGVINFRSCYNPIFGHLCRSY